MLKDQYVVMTLPEIDYGDLSAADLGPPEPPKIEAAELTPSEVKAEQRDPRKRLAPSMPWTLIEPTETEEVDAVAEHAVWGINAVGASGSQYDGSGIVVAVLDTGIDLDHPAFAGVDIIKRRNFTSESDDDTNGHGTHCAGTIFGQDVEGTRIGIARNIKRALIGKVIGTGSTTVKIAEAIYWAVSEGAHIISMSFRLDFQKYVSALMAIDGLDRAPATSVALEAYRKNVNLYSSVHRSVLDMRAFGEGIVFVAASGNESNRPKYEIAAYPPSAATDIIAVGALSRGANGYTVADFSNSQVEVSAPGVGIISAKADGGLVSKSGTSMATPHVAGIAALWAQKQLEMDGQISSKLLEARLIDSCTKEPLDPGHHASEDVGAGIVQAPLN